MHQVWANHYENMKQEIESLKQELYLMSDRLSEKENMIDLKDKEIKELLKVIEKLEGTDFLKDD